MVEGRELAPSHSRTGLLLGTISFFICFAAWGLISAFAPRFREQFGLTATQTAFLGLSRFIDRVDRDVRFKAGSRS